MKKKGKKEDMEENDFQCTVTHYFHISPYNTFAQTILVRNSVAFILEDIAAEETQVKRQAGR